MVNRTGQSYGVPMPSREMPKTTANVQINYGITAPIDRNAGQNAFTVSDILRNVSSKMQDRLDIIAESDALREGAIAGTGGGIPTLRDESTIKGRAFNRAAKDSAFTKFDTNASQALADYEEKYQADPQGFEKASSSYFSGIKNELVKLDPTMATRYENEFSAKKQSVLNRVTERHNSVVRDSQIETALRFSFASQDEISNMAGNLFGKTPEETEKTFTQMMVTAAKMSDVANQTSPDGQPIFSARERVTLSRQAENIVSESIGAAWLKNQPDMLSAHETWKKGEATFDMAGMDGNKTTLNLRDVIGQSAYDRVGQGFTENLKSELALQASIDNAKDRSFKDNSDSAYRDFTVLAQDGSLTLNMVEAAKASLEPDRYLTLRELAKTGGAAISEGETYSRLIQNDAAGIDIRDDLRNEFNAKRISRDDFVKLYDRNVSRTAQSVPNPINVGRDYVSNSLGKLSTELGFAQSLAIPQAESEYESRIRNFITKEQRQPDFTETMEIARTVAERYAVLDKDSVITTVPKPRFMSASEKNSNLSEQKVTEVMGKTRDYFLKKYNGDEAKMKSDPEYIDEAKNLATLLKASRMKSTNYSLKESNGK